MPYSIAESFASLSLSVKADGDIMDDKHKNRLRIVYFSIFAVVLVVLTVACIPLVKLLASDEGRIQLETFFSENAVWGVVLFLLLQILQVVVALIPGGIIQIIAGVAFGGFWGTVLSVIGLLVGTYIVFVLVRKFGAPIVDTFFDAKGIKQFSFLNDSKKLELAVFILFLIPGIPKDALSYFAPLTKIKMSTFIVLSTIARIPAIIMSCVFGSSLGDGELFKALIMFAVILAMGVFGILYKDRLIAKVKTFKENKK